MVVCVPFTGLGLYGGFRGNRWLRNRITIFKQFVIPSLQAQTDKEWVLWVAWRPEERVNPQVKSLHWWLTLQLDQPVVFTYSGCPFWDDKYPDDVAEERLRKTLRDGLPNLLEELGDCDEVYWLLQPSDDLYEKNTIDLVKGALSYPKIQAVTYTKGYIMNYSTKQILEYNPKTNPPFFAIKFPRNVFFNAEKHMDYTGPYKSHEYVGDKLNLYKLDGRGFVVGTHGENISTHFDHPYGGEEVRGILDNFGIMDVPPLKLPLSLRKKFMRRLPHKWRRKLRYIFGERFAARIYEWLRN